MWMIEMVARTETTPSWRDRPRMRQTSGVGFNPFRKHQRTAMDVVMVVVALALAAAVMVWALLPS